MSLEQICIRGQVFSKHQYVDSDIASQFLGLPKRTIEKLAARREFPVYKLTRKNYFLLSDLWEWAQSKRISGGHS